VLDKDQHNRGAKHGFQIQIPDLSSRGGAREWSSKAKTRGHRSCTSLSQRGAADVEPLHTKFSNGVRVRVMRALAGHMQ